MSNGGLLDAWDVYERLLGLGFEVGDKVLALLPTFMFA
jgi:hypothetical protein